MVTRSYRGLLVVVGLAALLAVAWADKPKKKAKANKLVGTWRVLSIKNGGQEAPLLPGSVMLKHITPTQFVWIQYDSTGRVLRMAGGPYTLEGDTYVEIPEYGSSSDFKTMQGKPQEFTWRIEGNRWYHEGKLSYGLRIEEVWERVEPKR